MPARLRCYAPPEGWPRRGNPVAPGRVNRVEDAFQYWVSPPDDRPQVTCEVRMWTRDGRLACVPGGQVAEEELPFLVTDDEHNRQLWEEAHERHHDPGSTDAGDR